MSHRIAYDEQTFIAPRQRQPRIENGAHLAYVRQLPCVITGTRPVDPAATYCSGSVTSGLAKNRMTSGSHPFHGPHMTSNIRCTRLNFG